MNSVENKIYVLHEIGAPNHYTGLESLLAKENIFIRYRIFSIIRFLIKGALRLEWKTICHGILSLEFLILLFFSRGKKVIIGIAPFDWRLLFYRIILRNHKIYLHTSHTTWCSNKFPKNSYLSRTSFIRKTWYLFLHEIEHVFCVTQKAKKELNQFYGIDNISVVYHTSTLLSESELAINYESLIEGSKYSSQPSCIFSGRLVEEKGLSIIITLAKKLPHINFKIAGKGPLIDLILSIELELKNFIYLGYLDKTELIKQYKEADFLLLPSKKTNSWEELFGISIIEAMGFGVIPIVTNHPGPKEIINHGVNGFLFSEKDYLRDAHKTIQILVKELEKKLEIGTNAIIKSREFSIEEIEKKWYKILE